MIVASLADILRCSLTVFFSKPYCRRVRLGDGGDFSFSLMLKRDLLRFLRMGLPMPGGSGRLNVFTDEVTVAELLERHKEVRAELASWVTGEPSRLVSRVRTTVDCLKRDVRTLLEEGVVFSTEE